MIRFTDYFNATGTHELLKRLQGWQGPAFELLKHSASDRHAKPEFGVVVEEFEELSVSGNIGLLGNFIDDLVIASAVIIGGVKVIVINTCIKHGIVPHAIWLVYMKV